MDSENYNFCFQVHEHAGRTVINEYIFFFLHIKAYMYIMCVYISTCSKYKYWYTSYSKHHLHVDINFNTCICNILLSEK